MRSGIITLHIITKRELKLDEIQSHDGPEFEAKTFKTTISKDDSDINKIIGTIDPDVIVTLDGTMASNANLYDHTYEIRKRWLHLKNDISEKELGAAVIQCYMERVLRAPNKVPLISVYTPVYNTKNIIHRPFNSLRRQTYNNWEWILVNDSIEENNETAKIIDQLMEKDIRVRSYTPRKHSGRIGRLKNEACALSNGSILVELDHDDELTPNCLSDLVEAFTTFPDAGFAYSDFAEIFENGTPASYPDGWCFGYGSYRREMHNGINMMVSNYPNLNAKTIRHIVGVPNHVRAWTRDFYFSIGGHNKDITVADDYELLIRTFLKTKMVKIPRLGYIQYYNTGSIGNTQIFRNAEIQRLVRYFRWHYEQQIHERLIELGVGDFIWDEKGGYGNMHIPKQEKESYANYILGR